MNPLAAIIALFWVSACVAVAINLSERQESLKAAVIMLFCQVIVLAFGFMPIIFGILNAS